MSRYLVLLLTCASLTLSMQPIRARSAEVTVGDMRIQALSETLVRIEQRGPKGFEDRASFTVVNRDWPGEMITMERAKGRRILTTGGFQIDLPENSRSLAGIRVQLRSGGDQYTFAGMPPADYFPGPVNNDRIWILRDSPRLVPPEWGATPAPHRFADDPTSGWDTTNNAEDVYVFLLRPGTYDGFRREVLRLIGRTPLPPLYAFGLWDSRYHPYSEETALQTIDTYRKKKIPLDVFVVDTDWRRGASHGYAVNDSLFPDMKRFIQGAHERHVRLMYNDHPEAHAGTALDPSEFTYRWEGLTGLLGQGIDVWWYDRNWKTGLHEPMSGISKEVWGMKLYQDITQRYRPDRRPLIMSNVDGIDNGKWNSPSHPAAHRFPVWWTGDQQSRWEYLEMGIANGINSGVHRLMPYVNEDLGGHTGGNPESEQYVRWIQYGVFSPVTRLHCTRGLTRFPWDYGEEAERIASAYVRLRYRLLPTLYAAARRAYEDGMPIMRRCDLEWPGDSLARRDDQFLFGDDLLVAPIAFGRTRDVPVPTRILRTADGKPGLLGEYFDNQDLRGAPALMRVDTTLNFFWSSGGPDHRIPDKHFSVRWTGNVCPEGRSGNLKIVSDDGVRVWIDDSLVVDAWHDQPATTYQVGWELPPGRSYAIRIEYYQNAGGAELQLLHTVDVEQVRNLWIPPGYWHDLWTGKVLHGPQMLAVNPVLWKCPLFVRNGGILLSLPQMQYTTEHPWERVIVDAFVPLGESPGVTRTLYEDDGVSPDYTRGAFCTTSLSMSREAEKVDAVIAKREGSFPGALSRRSWIIRLHLPGNHAPEDITVNGKKVSVQSADVALITETEQQEEAMPFNGPGSKPRSGAGPILQLTIPDRDVLEPIRLSFTLK